MKNRKTIEHAFIPDVQLRPGVPVSHIKACANYLCHKQPDRIIIAGDWWDLPSLSRYEQPGSKFFEGIALESDIAFGNEQMRVFLNIVLNVKGWDPLLDFLMGNHEYRMDRAINDNPTHLDGILGHHLFHLPKDQITVHPFLEIVKIDGIMYSHYFINPESLKKTILGGQMPNRLNKLKRSFTMGHQQVLMSGESHLPGGTRIRGLVAGAFYQHDEEYAGPQGNDYWRGIIYKHEVKDGNYDLMEVSLPYLLKNWS